MIKELILFTNRNCVGFDENGEQIESISNAISYSRVDKILARRVIDAAEECYLSEFRVWRHKISKEKMKCLLGLMEDQDETTYSL